MRYSELVFFIDDEESELLPADVLTEQFVCTDYHIDRAIFESFENAFLLG